MHTIHVYFRLFLLFFFFLCVECFCTFILIHLVIQVFDIIDSFICSSSFLLFSLLTFRDSHFHLILFVKIHMLFSFIMLCPFMSVYVCVYILIYLYIQFKNLFDFEQSRTVCSKQHLIYQPNNVIRMSIKLFFTVYC